MTKKTFFKNYFLSCSLKFYIKVKISNLIFKILMLYLFFFIFIMHPLCINDIIMFLSLLQENWKLKIETKKQKNWFYFLIFYLILKTFLEDEKQEIKTTPNWKKKKIK